MEIKNILSKRHPKKRRLNIFLNTTFCTDYQEIKAAIMDDYLLSNDSCALQCKTKEETASNNSSPYRKYNFYKRMIISHSFDGINNCNESTLLNKAIYIKRRTRNYRDSFYKRNKVLSQSESTDRAEKTNNNKESWNIDDPTKFNYINDANPMQFGTTKLKLIRLVMKNKWFKPTTNFLGQSKGIRNASINVTRNQLNPLKTKLPKIFIKNSLKTEEIPISIKGIIYRRSVFHY